MARWFLFLCSVLVLSISSVAAQTVPTKTLAPSQMVSPDILVARINTNCDVTRQFIKTIAAKHVILAHSTWKLASDSDAVVAERTHAGIMIADVWSQNNHYVWVHSHRIAQTGTQHATQLCFRPDGTLARIRQASTIPSLDAASATVAYVNTDGSIIRKVGVVVMNDPTIQKKITAEPFYSVLP